MDTAIRSMQRYIVNKGVPRQIRCDEAQKILAEKFQIYCKYNNFKLLFAPVDDHRAIGIVERLTQTLKARLGVMINDPNNSPYKLASDLVQLIKRLRINPPPGTKFSPFEMHMGRKPNPIISNLATLSNQNNVSWELLN